MNDEPTNLTAVSDADLVLVERELGRGPQPRSDRPGSNQCRASYVQWLLG